MFLLTPPRVWRQTHNYHHAHTAKLVGSHVGSYATVNEQMWSKLSSKMRLMYKAIRHPLTIAVGYLTIFVYGMCISSFLRQPRRNWDSALALILHVILSTSLVVFAGWNSYFFGLLLPLMVACSAGAYLFYAQHNFPDVKVQPREKWSYTRAALESSSFMQMSPMMHWFTGNIGYHHVHHLNSTIPFYRLPETMAALPELQTPGVTSLKVSDIIDCFSLKVWNSSLDKMDRYPSA